MEFGYSPADASVLGPIEPVRDEDTVVEGRYAFVALDNDSENTRIFNLDITQPLPSRSAALMPRPTRH